MNLMKVTPKGARVIGSGGRFIHFPDLELWEDADAKLARAKGIDRIAPATFEELIAGYKRGETVNLAGIVGIGQIRLGVSYALTVNGVPVFGSFDATHPTRAGHLTPAAGIFESGWPHEEAFRELCEEMVVLREDRSVVNWRARGLPLYEQRAERYARDHRGLVYSGTGCHVEPTTSDLHHVVKVGDAVYQVLVEWEPDTSSCELIFTGSTKLPDGALILDSEQLPNGEWRKSEIIWAAAPSNPLTTKAQVFLAAFQSGLRPIP